MGYTGKIRIVELKELTTMSQYDPRCEVTPFRDRVCSDYDEIHLDLKNPEGGLSKATLVYTNEYPVTHKDIVSMIPTGYELLSYHFAHMD